LRRGSDRQFAIRNLALDDGVNNGVQCRAREADPRTPMILLHEIDTFLFA
jgi:hypothetical protein